MDYLAGQAGGAPLLLVGVTRPDCSSGAPPRWSPANAGTLALEPLGSYVAGELMRRELAGRRSAARARAADPRHRCRATRSTSRSSSGCWSKRAWSCIGMGPGGQRPTFASLRCRRPSRPCWPLASISSTTATAMPRSEPPWSGRSSPEPPSSELCDEQAPPDPRAGAGEPRAQAVHRPEASTIAAGDAFRFSHVLVRDAAYAGLVKSTRAELHERYATWLESARSGSAMEHDEIIGYHFEQAALYRRELGDVLDAERAAAQASARLAAAGRRALASGDTPAGANLLEPRRRHPDGEPPAAARYPSRSHSGVDRIGRIEQADAGLDEILARAGREPRRGTERRVQLAATAWRAYVDSSMSRVDTLGGEACDPGLDRGLPRGRRRRGTGGRARHARAYAARLPVEPVRPKSCGGAPLSMPPAPGISERKPRL